ncbi:MAG: metal ABC transporter solute-binding protein, Zn/Mn family, partial [Alphaproteobacteria bacterium]
MRKQLAFVAVAVLAIAAWIFVETPAGSAQAKRVVVSIKPIHSLVAAVMQGVGTPELLVPGALPTTLPAGAEAKLAEADLVLWIGPSLEKFMERAVLLRRQGAVAIALLDAPGVRHMALPNNTPSAVVVAPRPPPKKAEEKPPVAKVEPPKSAPPKAATPAKKSKPDDDSYDPEAEKKPVPSEKVEAGQPPGQPPTAQTPPERKTLVVPRTDDKAAKSPDDEPDGDEPGDGDTAKAAKPADPRPVGPRLDPGTHLTRKRPDPKEVKKEDLQVGNPDPYIWLDPRNAVALVRAIAGTLSQIDPANARLYQRNAAALIANIES